MAKEAKLKKGKLSLIPMITKEDPFNIINVALLKKGRIKKSSASEIPCSAFSNEPFTKKQFHD